MASAESEAGRQIRAAALKAFSTRGYRGTSLRAIAAEAGCDVALVPYYFGNKASLFTSVVGEAVQDALQGIRAGYAEAAALPEGAGPEAALEIAQRGLRAWLASASPAGMQALLLAVSEGASLPEDVAQFAHTELQSCVDTMVKGAPAELQPAVASFASLLTGTTILRDFVGWEKLTRMTNAELADSQMQAFAEIMTLAHERAVREGPAG